VSLKIGGPRNKESGPGENDGSCCGEKIHNNSRGKLKRKADSTKTKLPAWEGNVEEKRANTMWRYLSKGKYLALNATSIGTQDENKKKKVVFLKEAGYFKHVFVSRHTQGEFQLLLLENFRGARNWSITKSAHSWSRKHRIDFNPLISGLEIPEQRRFGVIRKKFSGGEWKKEKPTKPQSQEAQSLNKEEPQGSWDDQKRGGIRKTHFINGQKKKSGVS